MPTITFHPHPGERHPVGCPHCDKTFSTDDGLDRHVARKHAGLFFTPRGKSPVMGPLYDLRVSDDVEEKAREFCKLQDCDPDGRTPYLDGSRPKWNDYIEKVNRVLGV